SVRVVHGDMEKASRSQTILTFAEKTAGPHDAAAAPSMCDSSNEIHILVASDVVARGVDFRDLNRVIHFDFAKDAAEYLHRVGRVAR
ncbi:helicase, partial [Entophlyctis helioformis]